AVAVALAGPLCRPLRAPRAHVLGDFGLHQGLRQRAYPLPEKVYVVIYLRLAQEFVECHASGIGHRSVLPRVTWYHSPDENHSMAGLVNRPQIPTRFWTLSLAFECPSPISRFLKL